MAHEKFYKDVKVCFNDDYFVIQDIGHTTAVLNSVVSMKGGVDKQPVQFAIIAHKGASIFDVMERIVTYE